MAIGDAVFARLRRVLDQPDTVILVGSGVSLWSGLPTWAGLLAQLADFLETNGLDRAPVDQELKGGDLLLAASYAVHQLHSRDLGRFIRSALNHPHATPSELHRIIANLGPSCFVTKSPYVNHPVPRNRLSLPIANRSRPQT
jgi:hypothetical protein